MDSLKSLLDKKQFDLVLDLTKDSPDPEAVFYRSTALISLNRPQEALSLLLNHRADLYEANPLLYMKVSFELRFILKQFDEAYKDLEWCSNQPYVSQAVEEQLRVYPGIIRSNEKAATYVKDYTPEEVEKVLLSSPDDYEVLSMLSFVQNHSLSDYTAILRQIAVSNRHPYVRTYALLLLIALKDKTPFSFPKAGSVYRVVPSDLVPPYTGEVYNGFVSSLVLLAKDPSLANTAHQILNDYIMDVYPEAVVTKADDKPLALAFLTLAKRYLKAEDDLSPLLETYHLEAKAVDASADQIQRVLDATPPFSY